MSSTTERFIRHFEGLVREVNRRAGAPSSHSFQIERAAQRDGVVRKQERLLNYVRDVRNALQHPQHKAPGHAVLISDAFLDEVEKLLNHLRKPPTANTVGVPRKKIRNASLDEKLGDLAAEMKRGAFSHVPILDERDVVIGVFNEAAVFDHLWAETETIVSRDMPVSDVLSHCRLDANHTETFRFLNPLKPLDDLVEIFLAVESQTTRVGAVFVTASGKDTEALQRMITPWDVLKSAGER